MRWKRNRARRYIYIFNLILFTIPFTDIHSLVRPLWKLISHHAANNLSIFSRWKITTWYSTIISKFYSFHECAVTFLQIYIYIYTRNTTLLPVFTSSCLESLIQFWSSLYLPPQQIPKRFQNTIRNTYKYGTKGKIRKFVRRSVQNIYTWG